MADIKTRDTSKGTIKTINKAAVATERMKKAYGSMPTHAASNQAIQQMYINGHFCYAYKFGIVTNGLGIVNNTQLKNLLYGRAIPLVRSYDISYPLKDTASDKFFIK